MSWILRKGIKLEEASRVLMNLKGRNGGLCLSSLWNPEEDLREARKTLEFVVNYHDQIHFLNLIYLPH
jgi:hypothetical protein